MNEKQIKMYLSNGVPSETNCKIINYEADFYILPFEIEATKGEFDFNNSPEALKALGDLTIKLRKLFDGNSMTQGFPNWNLYHSKLVNFPDFSLSDFANTPEMVARKVMYTQQHIINNCVSEDWYNSITEYIDWVIESFGKFPIEYGESVFLGGYIATIVKYIKSEKNLPEEKKIKLIEYFDGYLGQKQNDNSESDLNELNLVYQKWFNIFPFDLNIYFGEFKKYFSEILPIFNGGFYVDKYSGALEVKIHTKTTLIEFLVDITNELLSKINGVVLYENGFITDADKINVELVINKRKHELKYGYKTDTNCDDEKFRGMIEKWFEDEKRFITEITPLIKKEELIKGCDIKKNEIDITETTLSHSFISLICFYQGIGINSKNGKSVLAKFGGVGHPRKLIEKYNLNLIRDYRIHGKGSETENSNRTELARQKTFVEVIKYLKSNNIDSTEAEKDLRELQKYM